MSTPRSTRSRKSSARCSTSRGSTPARCKPEIVSFRIDDLLRQLEVEFTPLAQEKGLELDFVPCSLAVQSDRRLLRRLLQNLVSNAIKYTPKGRVLVGCRRRGARLRIDVYDTGLGIPHSKQQAIFLEFHRLDQGARVARGLGLGLSIVERIARVLDHRSASARRSAADRTSRSRCRCRRPARPGPWPRRARYRPAPARGLTVLCIDNEPASSTAWRRCSAAGAARCSRRSTSMRRSPRSPRAAPTPHALLVDYHLDGGNGIEAIGELRRRFGSELPAILITADRSPQVREEARAAGVQVLNKPVKPAALRALLAQWRVQRVAAAE